MGLFSSKKRTHVGTTVSRVLQDDALPDAIRTATMKALFADSEENDLVDHMLEEVANSIGVRAERMYDWARLNYVHGLPSGAILAAGDGLPAVRAVLEQLYGAVTIEYCHFGPANQLHVSWQMITDLYGYNPATNRLPGRDAAAGGHQVFLTDIEPVVPYEVVVTQRTGEFELWGPPARSGATPRQPGGSPQLTHTTYRIDQGTSVEYNVVSYEWKMPNGMIQEGTTTLNMAAYPDSAEYFQVRFRTGSVIRFFTYMKGLGTYPTLDNLFEGTHVTANAAFYPFTHFRYNKTDMGADQNSESYKDSKEMLRHLGIDYGMVSDAINENPDIGDVQQATMMFAVPANSQNQLELRYLHAFFSNWWGVLGQGYTTPTAQQIAQMQRTNEDSPFDGKNAIIIQDALTKMYLSSRGIYKDRKFGSIGKIGFCSGLIQTQNENVPYVDVATGRVVAVPTSLKTHVFRRQMSINVYEEVQVVGLQMLYEVEGDKRVLANEGDEILLIPIDRSLLPGWSMPDKEKLLSRSLHYVFNSLVEQLVRWYQQSWFQAFLIIVAIVVTIISYGSTWQTLALAISAGTMTFAALAYIIIVGIADYLVTAYAINLFVDAVGVKVAFVVALVAALAGMYQAYQAGSIAGAPTAEALLNLSTGLSRGVNTAQQGLVSDLLTEASEFEQYVIAQTKTLDTAQELLNNSSNLAPFVVFGESSQDFFKRTIHAGNIGTYGISAVRNYVEIALRLPKLNETIGIEL